MDTIDLVKLKLSNFFRSKLDRENYEAAGIFTKNNAISLLLRKRENPQLLELSQSSDGYDFQCNNLVYTYPLEEKPITTHIHSFSQGEEQFFILFGKNYGKIGILNNTTISYVGSIPSPKDKTVIVSDFKFNKQYVSYYGSRDINLAYSTDLYTWDSSLQPLITDARPLEVGGVYQTDQGLLLLYFKKEVDRGNTYRFAYLALFDKQSPETLLWRTNSPIWSQKDVWPDTTAKHIGTLYKDNRLISYWYVRDQIIYAINFAGFFIDPRSITVLSKPKTLHKHKDNPIIKPRSKNDWEAFNTFNPAALYADNKVHILYRAQGFDYVSKVGYATSRDGIRIDERSDTPIYSPSAHFENNTTDSARHDFMSGGSYGGCEDPRVTQIGNRVYMTYVAFDGWSPPRLALTSIHIKDFLSQRWHWTKPVLISPPGIIDKSGCLLPEKIHGKYVFFHRVFPNILIDFVDDLNFDGTSKWLKGQYQIKIRQNMWDSRKIGAGAPPLKTESGWLLIYYGVDDRDASKYHIGAMLLDLQDPTKVLHRTNQPIIRPTEEYENNGFKPGVAYPCGAVIVKDTLLVYYGGADSVVCVATARLQTFLKELQEKETASLERIQIQEVNY